MTKQKTIIRDELITVAEAAAVAGVDRRTIQLWFKAGLISGETVAFGSRSFMRVSRLSLEAHLREKSVESPDRG